MWCQNLVSKRHPDFKAAHAYYLYIIRSRRPHFQLRYNSSLPINPNENKSEEALDVPKNSNDSIEKESSNAPKNVNENSAEETSGLPKPSPLVMLREKALSTRFTRMFKKLTTKE